MNITIEKTNEKVYEEIVTFFLKNNGLLVDKKDEIFYKEANIEYQPIHNNLQILITYYSARKKLNIWVYPFSDPDLIIEHLKYFPSEPKIARELSKYLEL